MLKCNGQFSFILTKFYEILCVILVANKENSAREKHNVFVGSRVREYTSHFLFPPQTSLMCFFFFFPKNWLHVVLASQIMWEKKLWHLVLAYYYNYYSHGMFSVAQKTNTPHKAHSVWSLYVVILAECSFKQILILLMASSGGLRDSSQPTVYSFPLTIMGVGIGKDWRTRTICQFTNGMNNHEFYTF